MGMIFGSSLSMCTDWFNKKQSWMDGYSCMLSMKIQDRIGLPTHPCPCCIGSFFIIYKIAYTKPISQPNLRLNILIHMQLNGDECILASAPSNYTYWINKKTNGLVDSLVHIPWTYTNRCAPRWVVTPCCPFAHGGSFRAKIGRWIYVNLHSDIEYIDTSAPQREWMGAWCISTHLPQWGE